MTYSDPQQPVHPTMGVPAAQPAKRSWKVPLIIGGIVLALCCLGALILGIWGFNKIREAAGPTREAASQYLEDVEAGNYGSAYSRLCDDVRKDMNQQEFAQVQSLLPRIVDHNITGVSVSTVNGRETGTVTVTVNREGVGELQQEMMMVKEGGSWKVCQRGI